jgi:hypothetical protein
MTLQQTKGNESRTFLRLERMCADLFGSPVWTTFATHQCERESPFAASAPGGGPHVSIRVARCATADRNSTARVSIVTLIADEAPDRITVTDVMTWR